MASALGLGLLVGFTIAAMPGPLFFLTLRRTLERGWRYGLVSGMGIASGDAAYAALAAFGVTAVTNFLIGQRRWIGLAGGIALVVLGLRTLVTRPAQSEARVEAKPGLPGAYLSMVGLTLSNPPTILSFTAVFAGLGVQAGPGWASALTLVIGVALGSALWWVVLTGLASVLRRRLTPPITRGIGIVAGLALIGFGVFTIARVP
jgi:threonine/homoserine/homoserine lactone efflux protein